MLDSPISLPPQRVANSTHFDDTHRQSPNDVQGQSQRNARGPWQSLSIQGGGELLRSYQGERADLQGSVPIVDFLNGVGSVWRSFQGNVSHHQAPLRWHPTTRQRSSPTLHMHPY
ncbi:hypothetical protein EMIT0158MI4_60161 [Burkholderia ambifaria]